MANNLFATIDMGTNAFKLLIVQAHPPGKFIPLLTLKEPIILGRDSSSSSSSSSSTISTHSQNLSIRSLQDFNKLIQTHNVPHHHVRCVATSAIREARNKSEFIDSVTQTTGLKVEILSGEEESRFSYLGALQFLPVHNNLVLNIDIGGGSTEFAIGLRGKVHFCSSLKLGHVTLTQRNLGVENMRDYIRNMVKESGVIEKVKNFGFELALGSSGTIRAIEKAVFKGYELDFADNEALLSECKRDWRFSNEELKSVVESLCKGGEDQKVRRDGFFKRRSETIVAGGILLDEIFDLFGIKELLVSGYGLREGVIADSLAKLFGDGYDLNANARFRSVLQLAARFNGKKKTASAAEIASIAREIFEGLRKCKELDNNGVNLTVHLDEKDMEYLEAACLLHNIGLSTGKNGYHKKSYHIIMNGNHLHGYSAEEVKIIAFLTRHHRKKLPKFHDDTFNEFGEEAKQKLKVLCAIIRLSVVLHLNGYINHREMDFSHSREGFKLVIGEARDQNCLHGDEQCTADKFLVDLKHELEYFKKVFKQELFVKLKAAPSCSISKNDRC